MPNRRRASGTPQQRTGDRFRPPPVSFDVPPTVSHATLIVLFQSEAHDRVYPSASSRHGLFHGLLAAHSSHLPPRACAIGAGCYVEWRRSERKDAEARTRSRTHRLVEHLELVGQAHLGQGVLLGVFLLVLRAPGRLPQLPCRHRLCPEAGQRPALSRGRLRGTFAGHVQGRVHGPLEQGHLRGHAQLAGVVPAFVHRRSRGLSPV